MAWPEASSSEVGRGLRHAKQVFLRPASIHKVETRIFATKPVASLAIRHWRTMKRVELIETSVFTRQIAKLLDDEQYRLFQAELAANPAMGPLIKGGGGIRKVRVAVGARGKSSGARVIYYWAVSQDVILLLYAYSKNVAANLTSQQTTQLARLVKEEFGNEGKDF